MTFALDLQGIDKRFGARVANRGASLRVEAGTVHALVGENGAGKSTLLRVAYGSTRADAGRITVRGQEVALASHSPAGAIALGLGMVHQHFMLVPTLTVAENVVLGREPRRFGFVDRARARREIEAIAGRLGLAVEPRRRVADLSVGERQRVEIVKVLWRGAEVLLLDEPTAVLARPEVDDLFAALRRLAGEGKAIVVVTHRLDEVARIADRVTVMRAGEVVAEMRGGASPEAIARAMTGAPPAAAGLFGLAGAPPAVAGVGGLISRRSDIAAGSPGLEVAGLTVRAGEILGVAGVQGNGQTEIVLTVAGLARGQVRIGGRDLSRASTRERLTAGLGHIPEDRHAHGIILDFSLAENLILGRQRELGVGGRGVEGFARERLAALDVRPAEPWASAAGLSGGNQQKLVVARELDRPGLCVLVADEPTRGVDIAGTALIHQRIREARARGVAVLLVSSDLAELRALSDRIVVLYRGRVVAEMPVAEAGDERLAPLMTGARAVQQ